MKQEQKELPGLSGVGFSGSGEKETPFAESLAAVRKERELTIFEIAEKTRHTTRTVERWLAGSTLPEVTVRNQVLAILSDPDAEPSARTKRRAEEFHHLSWDKTKGWEMRITFVHGKKLVGIRKREKLRTRNLDEAIRRRDLLVKFARSFGLTIADRRQKKRTTSQTQSEG